MSFLDIKRKIEEYQKSYEIYKKMAKELLAIPMLSGKKSDRENEINKGEIEALQAEVVKWGGEDGSVIKGKYDELNNELEESLDEVIRLKEYENEYINKKTANALIDDAINNLENCKR